MTVKAYISMSWVKKVKNWWIINLCIYFVFLSCHMGLQLHPEHKSRKHAVSSQVCFTLKLSRSVLSFLLQKCVLWIHQRCNLTKSTRWLVCSLTLFSNRKEPLVPRVSTGLGCQFKRTSSRGEFPWKRGGASPGDEVEFKNKVACFRLSDSRDNASLRSCRRPLSL